MLPIHQKNPFLTRSDFGFQRQNRPLFLGLRPARERPRVHGRGEPRRRERREDERVAVAALVRDPQQVREVRTRAKSQRATVEQPSDRLKRLNNKC